MRKRSTSQQSMRKDQDSDIHVGWEEDTYQVRVFDLVNDLDVVQFDVQELIHRFEGAANGNIVL